MGFVVVIPARFGSTRLPGKPLADIAGRPMVWHVYQRALESQADEVIVATDDTRVADVVTAFGGRALLTDSGHPTGTDRLAEVADRLGLAPEAVVVNVQGDEPCLPPAAIDQVAALLSTHHHADIGTLCEQIAPADDPSDPHQVKVVCDLSGRALYFSRAAIPGSRHQGGHPHFRHIGIYAYRARFLNAFKAWAPTPLEQIEQLEQLRALERGCHIQVGQARCTIPPGVDTEADLERVRQLVPVRV